MSERVSTIALLFCKLNSQIGRYFHHVLRFLVNCLIGGRYRESNGDLPCASHNSQSTVTSVVRIAYICTWHSHVRTSYV